MDLHDHVVKQIPPTSIRTGDDDHEPRNAAYWKRQCRKAWAEIYRLNLALQRIEAGNLDISSRDFAGMCARQNLVGHCEKCGDEIYQMDGAGEDYAHACTETPNAGAQAQAAKQTVACSGLLGDDA